MAAVAAAAAAPAAGDADVADQPAGFNFMSIFRSIMMYFLISKVFGMMFGSNTPAQTAKAVERFDPETGEMVRVGPGGNLWQMDTPYDLVVFASPRSEWSWASDLHAEDTIRLWENAGLTYNWGPSAYTAANTTFNTPQSMLKNETLFAHVFLTQRGHSPDPDSDRYNHRAVVYGSHALAEHRKRPLNRTTINLITTTFGTEEEKVEAERLQLEEAEKEREIVLYWRPRLSLKVVCDHSRFNPSAVSESVANHYQQDATTGQYWPVLYFQYFWELKTNQLQVNETLKTLDLEMSLEPLSLWRFAMEVQMEETWAKQNDWGMSSGEENETLRTMIVETNPWLLGLTFVVSLLHTVFDCLAFKNDITFWKERDSAVGLSLRAIVVGLVMQVIILFYLIDSEETSFMIVASSAVGVVIEFWKITKAGDVTWGRSGAGPNGLFPWLLIRDKRSADAAKPDADKTQNELLLDLTAKYDKEAMTYMSYLLFPCVVGYSIYSLLYDAHKGWYQWVLHSLVGCVYTFGFILMVPQLYMNYKLKSVAHLPWRMLTYKSLNTFIDDMFAFIIKMPTMHRLSCFRDDIVFLIFLYQKWIYPTDYSRVNEFGYRGQGEGDEGETAGAPASAITAAPPASTGEGATADDATSSTPAATSTPDDASPQATEAQAAATSADATADAAGLRKRR